jgi:glycosyltransferase involved in cell wall biosynthesis
MNIALIVNEYVIDGSGAGGLANYTYRIAKALRESGHKPIVIYCPWCKKYLDDEVITNNGITVYIANPRWHKSLSILVVASRLLKKGVRLQRLLHIKFLPKIANTLDELTRYFMYAYGARRKISELQSKIGIDVCQFTHLYGLGALSDKRIPTVCRLSSHPDLWQRFGFNTTKAEQIVQNIAIIRARMLIAPSSFVGNYVKRKYGKNVLILPSPYLLRPDQSYISNQDNGGYGLYFGSLAEWKGIRVITEALKSVFSIQPKFRFLFIGRNLGSIEGKPPSEFIEDELKAYKANVKVLDNQAQVSLRKYIDDSLFCCFPTLADNFPNVVLDAMSAEKCIISTYGRGVDEQIINGESGLLVAPESVSELSMAIMKVINMSEEERCQYGRKAKERLEQFSPQACASQLVETYSQYLLD